MKSIDSELSPTPARSSSAGKTRRQWQIQDGPKGTLRNLRSQLAEDGCVESQVILAKHLLAESQDGGVWKKSTTQAVHWLIKASEYGNSEAADLLNRCFKSGTGITEQNYKEVQICVNMSEDERAFRSAARNLFITLTPFGQEFVTAGQLRARISNEMDSQFNRTVTDENGSSENNAESAFIKWYRDSSVFEVHISEDSLIEIAGRLAEGELPHVLLNDVDQVNYQCCHNNKIIFKKVPGYISQYFTAGFTKMITRIAEQGDVILTNLLPFNQLRPLAIVILFVLLPSDSILLVLPIVGLYVCLIVMIVSTLQMIQNIRSQCLFTSWTRIFLSADATLKMELATTKFYRRHLKPYIQFFTALFMLLCLHPYCPSEAIFSSEITIVTVFFFVLTTLVLNVSYNTWTIWSFTMMSILVALNRLHGRPGISTYVSELCGLDTMEVRIANLIVIHIGIDLIPVALLTVLLMLMTFHNNRLLLPNLVCLTWIHLTGIFFKHSNCMGLARSAAIVGVIVTLPITNSFLIPLPLIFMVLSYWMEFWQWNHFYPIMTAIFVIFITSFVKYAFGHHGQLWRKWIIMVVNAVCIIWGIIHLVPALNDFSFNFHQGNPGIKFLDWKTFSDLCYESTTEQQISITEIQLNCQHLSGLAVHWKGNVKSVSVLKIDNKMEAFVDHLPIIFAAKLKCMYGSSYDDCHDRENPKNHLSKTCAVMKSMAWGHCHLKNFNMYEFEIVLSVGSDDSYWNTAEIALSVGDTFKRFIFKLLPGDQVEFEGSLEMSIVAINHRRPIVKISMIRCVDCVHQMEAIQETSAIDFKQHWSIVLRFIFDFIFKPFVELN